MTLLSLPTSIFSVGAKNYFPSALKTYSLKRQILWKVFRGSLFLQSVSNQWWLHTKPECYRCPTPRPPWCMSNKLMKPQNKLILNLLCICSSRAINFYHTWITESPVAEDMRSILFNFCRAPKLSEGLMPVGALVVRNAPNLERIDARRILLRPLVVGFQASEAFSPLNCKNEEQWNHHPSHCCLDF